MRLILSICLIWISNVFSMPEDIESLKIKKNTGHFYPTLGLRLVTFREPDNEAIFGDLTKKDIGNPAAIRRVKVADLNMGLNKGDIIYHVHLHNKTVKPYEMKEYINVMLVSDSMKKDVKKSKYYWNEYYLILSDSPDEIENAIQKVFSIPQRDGFAYIGKEYDFSKARFEKFTTSSFTGKKLPPPSRFWKKTKREEVRYVSLLDNDLYFTKEDILIPRKGKKTLYGGWLDLNFYSNKENYLELIILNKNQWLIPLRRGPFKYKLDFLLLESGNPQRIEAEFELGW